MNLFTGKKLLLAGFILMLLIGIPLSVYLIQQQQETRSEATPSTVLSFVPASTETTPMQKRVGDTVTLDINVNPGNNLVTFMKLEINYDPDKLATEGAQPFVPNTTVFPTIVDGPIYQEGKILVSLSIGGDPTKALGEVGKAGTITFKARAKTDSVPTQVSYGSRVEVISAAGPSTGSNDSYAENVLSSTQPSFIAIGDGSPITPTITTTPSVSTSPSPSGPTTNSSPQCQNLIIDRQTSGTVPYSVTFTANGTDSDGTISKVTFNFGDGPLVNETLGGGIGSNQVSLQKAHTYNNAGTFTATVIFTDDRGGVSTVGTCTQAITVTTGSGGGGGGGTGGGTQPTATPTNTPTPTVDPNIPTPTATPVVTMPDTGPEDLFVGLGAVASVITLIGGILFFAL